MNLVLQRYQDGFRNGYAEDGVFSTLYFDDVSETVVAATVERSYPAADPEVASAAPLYPDRDHIPKLTPGVFVCQRGMHELEDGTKFETFEILGVPGHSGVLFHPGNKEQDSKGCVCTGEEFVAAPDSPLHCDMVTNSRATFAKFMTLQAGLDKFNLTVIA